MALVFEICSFAFATQAWDASEDEANSHAQYTYWEMNLDAGLNVAAGAAFFVSTVVTDGFLVRIFSWYVPGQSLIERLCAVWPVRRPPVVKVVHHPSGPTPVGHIWYARPPTRHVPELTRHKAFDLMQAYQIGAWADQSLWVVPGFTPNIISVALAQALHVIIAALLLTRLATTRRQGTGKEQIGAGGLAVESALLYGVVSVLWLGTCCAQNFAANAFLPMYVQLQVGLSIVVFVLPIGSLMRYLLGHHGPSRQNSGPSLFPSNR